MSDDVNLPIVTVPRNIEDKINALCNDLYTRKFPIQGATAEGTNFILDPKINGYQQSHYQLCTAELKSAYDSQERSHPFGSGIWTLSDISDIGIYTTRNKLKVAVTSTTFNRDLGATPFHIVPQQETLYLGLSAFVGRRDLTSSLDHELGHLQDYKLLSTLYPQTLTSTASYKQIAATFRKALRDKFPTQSTSKDKKLTQKDFDRLTQEIFGDLNSDNDQQRIVFSHKFFSELFRYGSDIQRPSFEKEMLDPITGIKALRKSFSGGDTSTNYNDATGKPRNENLTKLMFIAILKKAGLFDKYKAFKTDLIAYDETSTKGHKPEHLKFFLACLEAAEKYFPKKEGKKKT